MIKQVVEIWESERGWGQRLDEERLFDSVSEAAAFIANYNSKNNLPEVPDWYSTAKMGASRDVPDPPAPIQATAKEEE